MFLYVDGTVDVSQAATGSIAQNTNALCIGANSSSYFFNGEVDEASIYNRALSAAEIQTIYNASSNGKCPLTSLVIVSQPTNQSAYVGSNITFKVTTSGSKPLSYQWFFNGTNIVGATSSVLLLVNVQPANAGSYSVQVTNRFDSVVSSNAVLTVLVLPPKIVSQPTNQTVYVGSTASFNVMASGTLPLSYQWSFNGTNIAGATGTTLTLTNVQLNQAGNYAVLVTNAYGSILSSNAVLTVNLPPPCTAAPSGLVGWWPAEGNANDSIGQQQRDAGRRCKLC